MEFTLFETLAELGVTTWICLALALALIVFFVVMMVRSRQQAKAQAEETVKEAAPLGANRRERTKVLVYGALCVALSFLLSYIKLFSLPQGGSITLASMLPLAFFANRFGLRRGLLVGAVAGVLQFLQEPFIIHWAQPFFDYVFAFAALGLAGLFPRSLALGTAVGAVGRIILTIISGAIFWRMYAPAGMNPWIYSITYNGTILIPDLIICVVIALLPPVTKALARAVPERK